MYRRCPRCGFEMELQNSSGVELDYCPRCRGLYFDAGEFSQHFSGAQLGREAYVQHWIGSGLAQDQGTGKARCPDQHGPMHAYLIEKGDDKASLSICDQCGGLWVDRGQIRGLRSALEVENSARLQAQDHAGGLKIYLFQLFTGMPIEVYNPVRRKPVVLFNMIALLLLAFAAQFLLGEAFTLNFALVPVQVFSHPWSLLTAALLHGGLLHILGNLYFFYVFGDNVEDRLGKSRFFMFMLSSAVLGNLLYLIFHLGSSTPELGFSGVVAGVMAAYLVLFPKVKLWVVLFFVRFKISSYWYIGAWIVLQVVAVLSGVQGHVAYMVHIGGFLTGGLLAWKWKKQGRKSTAT